MLSNEAGVTVATASGKANLVDMLDDDLAAIVRFEARFLFAAVHKNVAAGDQRCRLVAGRVSAWDAVWWAKARPRSVPPIVISKAAWVMPMRRSIWVRPPS